MAQDFRRVLGQARELWDLSAFVFLIKTLPLYMRYVRIFLDDNE